MPKHAIMMLGPGLLEPPIVEEAYNVDNSSVQGIFSFGGYAFPILTSCSRPDLTIQIRDDNGDTEVHRQVTQSTGSRPVSTYKIDGTNFDQGGAGYDTDGSETAILSFCSHGRWITNAGVSRTVSRTTGIHIRGDWNGSEYPILETFIYALTAVFSG